jgi:extracellular factor (EF) 3-hydroxypalmitic acid methyl ester biosynthesis protein
MFWTVFVSRQDNFLFCLLSDCLACRQQSSSNASAQDKLAAANNHFVLARKMVHPANEMSATFNGHGNGIGNGHGTGTLPDRPKKMAARHQAVKPSPDIQENRITFKTADGVELRGTLVRLTRHIVVFELHDSSGTVRLSETLNEFKIILQSRTVYSGRAVVHKVVDAGTKALCEATLNELLWVGLIPDIVLQNDGELKKEFKKFLMEWQKLYKVLPEFKEAVSDIKIFLMDLRLWLEQMELGIQASPKPGRAQLERSIIEKLAPQAIPVLNTLFEKFERIAAGLTEELRPAHRNYVQRNLHEIVFCAPFACRTYQKPLGYPGDYEMVNMMVRDPQEGGSVFAKIFNVWLLQQGSAAAHRNRLADIAARIESEALRISRSGRKARIFNFACGPALEVQDFIRRSPLSAQVEFTLSDFNTETLEHTRKAIEGIKERFGRRTSVQLQKKAVQQLFRESQKPAGPANRAPHEYDFIYCAGLFDYLTDQTCRHLIKIFHQWLAPGGLLYLTNVTPFTPNRGSMDLILDWHLIYRNVAQFEQLCSDIISKEMIRVRSDETGVNIFLEARKSDDH